MKILFSIVFLFSETVLLTALTKVLLQQFQKEKLLSISFQPIIESLCLT